MPRWTHTLLGEHYYAVLVDQDGEILHTHPIPFSSDNEAARAAVRLNTRDREEGR